MTLLELHLHLALIRHVLAKTEGLQVAYPLLLPLRICRVAFSLALFVALGRGERWRLIAYSNTVNFMLEWHRAKVLPLLPINLAFVHVPLRTRRILRVLLGD